jgi:hypothetical protein
VKNSGDLFLCVFIMIAVVVFGVKYNDSDNE